MIKIEIDYHRSTVRGGEIPWLSVRKMSQAYCSGISFEGYVVSLT